MKLKLMVEIDFDDTQHSTEAIRESVQDILTAHEYNVDSVEIRSYCCDSPLNEEGCCVNCGLRL